MSLAALAAIVFLLSEGFLTGWIFNRVKKNRRFSLRGNVLLGIAGIFLGLIIWVMITDEESKGSGVLIGFTVHIIVAFMLLFLANLKSGISTDKIFISYRRQDNPEITEYLYKRLVSHFGEAQVFRDKESIPLAVNFKNHIYRKIRGCRVFIAVIGDQWLEAKDRDGNRRIDDRSDFVRIEIESALKSKVPIIPLLIEKAQIPKSDDLPPSLKGLSDWQSFPLEANDYFDMYLDHLIAEMEKHLRTKKWIRA